MTDSILDSVKLKVNLTPDNVEFDSQIIDYINAAFGTLHQLGIGPIQGFMIDDATARWDDFLKGDVRFNAVKTYVAMKVRLVFDPPSTSFTIDAMQKAITELEIRLNIAREYTIYGVPTLPISSGGSNGGNSGGSIPGDGSLDGGGPSGDGGLDGGGPASGTDDTVYDGGTP